MHIIFKKKIPFEFITNLDKFVSINYIKLQPLFINKNVSMNARNYSPNSAISFYFHALKRHRSRYL